MQSSLRTPTSRVLATLILAGSIATVAATQLVQAADGVWNQSGSGPFDWGDPANWVGGTVADGADFTANFVADIIAGQTVNLDTPRTIGNIIFTDTISSDDLTVSGANTLTLNVSAGIPVINVTQSGRMLTVSSDIAGVTGLQKSGPGVLSLGGANTYTGVTSVNAGLLRLDSAGALPGGLTSATGTSNLNLAGGVVGLTAASGNFSRVPGTGPGQAQFTGSGGVAGGFAAFGGTRNVNFGGGTINWNAANFIGNGNILVLGHASSDSTITWTQAISLAGAGRNVRVDNGSASIDAIMSSVISGGTSGTSNSFTKSGAGTLAFTAQNTYWGATTISAGTLMIGNGTGNTGGLSNNSATVSISAGATLALNRTAIVVQGANSAVGNTAPISGAGSVLIIGGDAGTGGLALNQANTYTGGTTINSGVIRIHAPGIAGTQGPLGNGGTFTINGGTIDSNLASPMTVLNVNPIVVGGDFAFTIPVGGTSTLGGDLTLPGPVNLGNATRTITANVTAVRTPTLTLTGNISNGGIRKAGLGTLALGGNNAYSGATTVSGGMLSLRSSNALQNSPLDTLNSVTGDAANGLQTTVTTLTVGGLTGDKNLADVFTTTAGGYGGVTALTLNPITGATPSYSGSIADGATGMTLTKSGEGTQTLAGDSTYTGATTVVGGTLFVSGSLSGSPSVAVSSGATLGGAGSITAAVNITGTLAPGASVESLATGSLSLNDTSTFAAELDSSASPALGSDLLKVAGNLSLSGNVTLTLVDLAASAAAFADGTSFSLVNYSGSWNGGTFTFAGNPLPDGSTFTAGLTTWQIDYAAANGGLNFSSEYFGGADSFVNLVAVPEPSSAALLALGALGLIRRRRPALA